MSTWLSEELDRLDCIETKIVAAGRAAPHGKRRAAIVDEAKPTKLTEREIRAFMALTRGARRKK